MKVLIEDISKFDYDIEIYKDEDFTILKIIEDTLEDGDKKVCISVDKETLKRLINSLVECL